MAGIIQNREKENIAYLNLPIKNMNEQDIIDGLVRTERISTVFGQLPGYVRDDIASLVAEDQIPGSFGDLIKRAVEITEEHQKFEGINVVSMIGRRSAS